MPRAETPVLDSPATGELTERRYVYNGNRESSLTGEPSAMRGNRPIKRRRRSPFNIIVALVAVSILIVFYVWNKITVNRLVVEVGELQGQYQKIVSSNDVLRAEINKKSTLERIGKLATQMGLTNPREQPIWIEIDTEELDQLRSSD